MLQLRVFYAMKDARTPTLIQLLIVTVKIPILLLCPMLLPPERVVLGLAAANALSFVAGALVGQLWLGRRLGRLGTVAFLITLLKTTGAAVVGGAAGWAVLAVVPAWTPEIGFDAVGTAWSVLVIGGAVGVLVTVVAMWALRLSELGPLWARLRPLSR
jgi:putative peptidoglycan lipid II flippase